MKAFSGADSEWPKMIARGHEVANKHRSRTHIARSEKALAGCIDCNQGIHGMDYMVEDEVWFSAGLDKKELCCETCLEKRIGRPLVIEDYTNALINMPLLRGYLLGKRDMETQQNLQQYIASISPIYVLLRCDVTEQGELKIHGFTEGSVECQMHEKFVNKFWTGEAYGPLGDTYCNGLEWAKSNQKGGLHLFQLGTDECPIEVSERMWECSRKATLKFSKRNLAFTVKEGAYKWASVQAMMMEGRVRHFQKEIQKATNDKNKEQEILDERFRLATMEANHILRGIQKVHERTALRICKEREQNFTYSFNDVTFQPVPTFKATAKGIDLTWHSAKGWPSVLISWEDIFAAQKARQEAARAKRKQRAEEKL